MGRRRKERVQQDLFPLLPPSAPPVPAGQSPAADAVTEMVAVAHQAIRDLARKAGTSAASSSAKRGTGR